MRLPLAGMLLASLLVTGGCLGFVGESRPPSDQQAVDALNRTQTALANVTSYRARNNGSAKMTEDEQQVAVALNGEVIVNVSAREVNSVGRLRDPTPPSPEVRRTYVSGFTANVECRLVGWDRRNLSESARWFEYTPIGEQLAFLDRTPVYWRGTERLNGTETAVVVAHPTEQELEAASGLWSLNPTESEDANFRNATVTMWISTETWRPLRTRRETTWRNDGADVTLTATWRFDEYNAPAVATRPSFDESEIRKFGC